MRKYTTGLFLALLVWAALPKSEGGRALKADWWDAIVDYATDVADDVALTLSSAKGKAGRISAAAASEVLGTLTGMLMDAASIIEEVGPDVFLEGLKEEMRLLKGTKYRIPKAEKAVKKIEQMIEDGDVTDVQAEVDKYLEEANAEYPNKLN